MFPYRAPQPGLGAGNGSPSRAWGLGLYDRCARCGRPFLYQSESRYCTGCLACSWCQSPITLLDEPRGCPSCEEVFCGEAHYLDHTFATGHHGW